MVTKPDVAAMAKGAMVTGAQLGNKVDPASAVEDRLPEGRFKRIFNRLKKAAPPYTFEKLASSAYLSPGVHFFARASLAAVYVCAFFTVFKKGIILALPATIAYFVLYACLAFFTMRYKTLKNSKSRINRVSRITMLRESLILGVVYQLLASLALWMFPLAILAAVRNQARATPKHLILYVVHALPAGTFVADTLLFGNAPHFRKFALPLPILVDAAILFVGTKTGKLKKPKLEAAQTFWKIFIAGTMIWALGSAFLALWISRATNCCAKNKDVQEGDLDDFENERDGQDSTNYSRHSVDIDHYDDSDEEVVYRDVEMGGGKGDMGDSRRSRQ